MVWFGDGSLPSLYRKRFAGSVRHVVFGCLFGTGAAEGRSLRPAGSGSRSANGRLRARARRSEGAGTFGHQPSTVGFQQCGRSFVGCCYKRSSKMRPESEAVRATTSPTMRKSLK